MAPNLTIHFWDANDINNATPILEITDEDEYFRGFKLTPDLYALGGWELTLARRVGFALFDSGAVQPEVFVRFLIHAWSDTDYYFGGVLQKRNQVVVHREEQGEETFIFGGPGPKAYMDRYRLGIEQLTGTGWNLDLENGVWRWNETATAGRVLNRVIAEDAAAADPALPDLTKTFTDSDDSDSNPWTNDVAGAGEYEIPIGNSLLETIFDLEDLADLYTVVNLGDTTSPLYQLEAFEAYGDDVTGTSPGAGVGLLREGLNIANDSLTVEGVGIRKATHVIVEGKDGAWATAVGTAWSSGEYIKWGKIEYLRSSNVTILERAGLRWIRRQENGDRQITVEIAPGASEATGFYFPGPGEVLWPGNTVTLDTAEDGSTHTPLDFNNEDQLLTGLDLTLGPAGDTATADKKAKSWDIKLRLNWERAGFAAAPDQTSAASGGGSCRCIKLCAADETELDLETSTAWKRTALDDVPAGWHDVGFDDSGFSNSTNVTDASWDDAGSPRWIWGTVNTEGFYGFRREFTITETPYGGTLELAADGSCQVFVNGTLVQSHTGFASTAIYSVGAGEFVVGTNCISIIGTNSDAPGTNPGGVYLVLQLSTADTTLVGGDGVAARCDHLHLIEALPTAETDTELRLAPDGIGGVEWATSTPFSFVGTPVSWLPLGIDYTDSGTLNTADRADALPVSIPGAMFLRSLQVRMSAASTGTWQWGLFSYASSASACTKLAGGSGTLNGTGWQSIVATSAPVSIDPGNYMLIIKAPAANQGTWFTPTGGSAGAGYKTIAGYTWDDTPDLTTGWGDTSAPPIVRLRGDLLSGTLW